MLAMLAGEQWRIDLFRRKGDIYSESAAKITGVPMPAQGPHPHRKSIGKVAELASGYQGWIGAWKNFGAEKHFSTDDEIKQAILKWREASPNIVEMWGGQLREDPRKRWDDRFAPEFYGVEGAAVSAIANPGHHYTFRLLSYIVED
ncbi:MAG: hypothetical protein GY859_37115, partial [Desulfobacterales bacterium]|nr:hypothetical protein [Desulfobacterales bacterium]